MRGRKGRRSGRRMRKRANRIEAKRVEGSKVRVARKRERKEYCINVSKGQIGFVCVTLHLQIL